MKKVIINENQRGFLFKNGKYRKLLLPGKYRICGDRQIETVSIFDAVESAFCPPETLLADPAVAAATTVIEVAEDQIALHYSSGQLQPPLCCGKHIFWSAPDKHEFRLLDTSAMMVPDDIPKSVVHALAPLFCVKREVQDHQMGRLFINGKFIRTLEPGHYFFWKNGTTVDVDCVDMRLMCLHLSGQEILTQDKVSLRINFTCTYHVTDPVRILSEIDNYEEQLHLAAQLALRDYVGKYTLDDILEGKDQMALYLLQKLKEKEKELFLEITDAGIKDIILPGEIRDIMNTVLIAEKRAQASVITRREEVASTRSLLNTAKLMDENETLYKLKELEYIERICENVGSLNLSGGDILAQLTGILRGASST